jgi:hypothetical protein
LDSYKTARAAIAKVGREFRVEGEKHETSKVFNYVFRGGGRGIEQHCFTRGEFNDD